MATLKDVPVISKAVAEAAAQQTNESLPPPGFRRDEEIAQRKDTLAEAIEAQSPDSYALDPRKLEIDREIAYHINRNELEITGAQEGFVYCWEYFGQNGRLVMGKKRDGWEVVNGNDPEAQELKYVDGTRHLGDVLLMRIPKERYEVLQGVDRYRRQRQQEGIIGNLRHQADKTGGAIILHENDKMTQIAAQRAAMQQQAYMGIDKMLREGSVPGLPTYDR